MVQCASPTYLCPHGQSNWHRVRNFRSKEGDHSMLTNPDQHSLASRHFGYAFTIPTSGNIACDAPTINALYTTLQLCNMASKSTSNITELKLCSYQSIHGRFRHSQKVAVSQSFLKCTSLSGSATLYQLQDFFIKLIHANYHI